ncbi:MAG: PAS domain-containing protein, partial [Halobaculum sp.]
MTREGDSAVVLYVDDEERVTRQVRERVGDAETTVRVADSVAAAESTLGATAVDCVVTAYVLPDGTGVDLLRRIDETHPELPTVLFTAEGSESVASAATAAGVSEYIPRHESRRTTAEGGADSEETPWDGERDAFEELSRRVETLTEVKRQRDSARRARERFQHTIERTTDAVYAVDTDWRIEYVNERMARRVGRDREAVVGKVLWEEFSGLAGTRLETAYRRAMATGEPTSLEEYLPEPFDYWVRVRVFPDDGGLTVFSQEVTEQIERQHELERDEAILQTVHDAVFVVDQQFCVRYANPAAARTLGEADTSALEGELLGDLVGDRVTSETVAEFAAAVQETLRAPDEPADDETDESGAI